MHWFDLYGVEPYRVWPLGDREKKLAVWAQVHCTSIKFGEDRASIGHYGCGKKTQKCMHIIGGMPFL